MKLPNADKAIVEREKIRGLFLDPAHPTTVARRSFFERLGFRSK